MSPNKGITDSTCFMLGDIHFPPRNVFQARFQAAAVACYTCRAMMMGTDSKCLPNQLDAIESVLSNINSPLPIDAPALAAFRQASRASAESPATVSPGSTTQPGGVIDWCTLPTAVVADSNAMGVSTRKLTPRRLAKQRSADPQKVAARVDRKRAQVESFLLVLQPLLESAGHTAASARSQGAMDQVAGGCEHAPCAAQPSWAEQAQQQKQGERQCPPSLQPTQLQTGATQQEPTKIHIVDFGCGTGNLLLPLAVLLPHCQFTGVDMKPAALQLLLQRAQAAGLTNVSVFQGMIEQYRDPFDVALALHACGNATDHVLQMAVDQQAAFVVSPCCVGKLCFSLTGGTSFHKAPVAWTPTQPGDRPVQQQQEQQEAGHQHAGQRHVCFQAEMQQQQQQEQQHQSAGNIQPVRLRHPRSNWLLSHLPDPETHFRIMAKVADMSHAPDDRAGFTKAFEHRAAVADMCKRFVELDRCAAAAEAGYTVGLFKVLQANTMAKNDLLVGLPLTASDTQAEGIRRTAAATNTGWQHCLRQCAGQLTSMGLLHAWSQSQDAGACKQQHVCQAFDLESAP